MICDVVLILLVCRLKSTCKQKSTCQLKSTYELNTFTEVAKHPPLNPIYWRPPRKMRSNTNMNEQNVIACLRSYISSQGLIIVSTVLFSPVNGRKNDGDEKNYCCDRKLGGWGD